MPGLPERPDFDQLRRQARELLRAAVSGDPAALLRLRAVSERITLADAQLAIAREHGFTSWAHMKREVAGRGAGGLAGPGQGVRSAAERYLRELAAAARPEGDGARSPELTEQPQGFRVATPTEKSAREGLGVILTAGDTLVALGAVERQVVDDIAADYVAACQRQGDQFIGRALEVRAEQTRALAAPFELRPVTVVPGPIEASLPWGDVVIRFVRFEQKETVLSIVGRLNPSRPPKPATARWGVAAYLAPHRLRVELSDDQGNTSDAYFSGSGIGEDRFDGRLTTEGALSARTAWLELDGRRMALPAHQPTGAAVSVESLADPPSALGYLWHRVAMLGRPLPLPPPTSVLEVPIAALVAVGAIAADDPELEEMRRVLDALWSSPRSGSYAPLPEPWGRVLERRARASGGMRGTVPVEVVVPSVEGISVGILALEATADGFGIEVELAPDGALAWWAEDDLGGVHLGHGQGVEGTPERSLVRVVFLGGLDEGVRELVLMPTGVAERASVRIPLGGRLHGAAA
jgi:hypothetical protein